MDHYIFEKNQHGQELARLRLIEQALDAASIAHLQSTRIQRGWCCLELGAGAGSLAQWLANVVGDQGQVVVVDLKTDYLQHLSGPAYRIIQGNFLEIPLEPGFDLIHLPV